MGQRRKEILLLGEFRARVDKRPFLTFQFPKSFLRKPRASTGKFPTPQTKISSICAVMAPTADPDLRNTKYGHGSREDTSKRSPPVERECTELTSYLRKADGKLPGHHSTHKLALLVSKPDANPWNSIHMEHVANRPDQNHPPEGRRSYFPGYKVAISSGPQGYHLKMRGSAAHTSRRIHMAHAAIWALKASGHQARLDSSHAVNFLPGEHPLRINKTLPLGAWLRRWKNPKVPHHL